MKITAILTGLLLASPVYAAQESVPSIEATAPLEDLLQDQSFREDYDNGLYDRRGGDFKLVSFSEYAYNPSDMSDYGLYVYVYNPEEEKAVDLISDLNSIQIKSNVFGGDTFNKYGLDFISRNGDWFYKFKVNLGDAESNKSLQIRTYEVSGIELIQPGDRNPTDYVVGIEYAFSGYAKGINGQEASSLTCVETRKETLELPTIGGYYRVNSSLDGLTGTDMFYVCFAVPNEVLAHYGNINSVRYTYFDYYLSDLFVFTGVDAIGSAGDVSAGEAMDNFANGVGVWGAGDFKSNHIIDNTETYDSLRLFLSEGEDGILENNNWKEAYVSGETIRERFYEAEEQGSHLYNPSLNTSPEKGPTEIKASDKLSLTEVEPADWWLGSWPIGGGDTATVFDIKGIEELQPDNGLNGYYIMNADKPYVEDFISEASTSGKTAYILRFAVENYRVAPLWRQASSSSAPVMGIRINEMHAIINFDIISVSFMSEQEKITVLPVVSSPIDIFPAIDVPGYRESYDWARLILIVVGVIIGLVIMIAVFETIDKYRKEHPKQAKAKKPSASDDVVKDGQGKSPTE